DVACRFFLIIQFMQHALAAATQSGLWDLGGDHDHRYPGSICFLESSQGCQRAGPGRYKYTPGLSVARAYPSAVNAALFSTREEMNSSLLRVRASKRPRACCPGMPKTVVAPRADSISTTRSPPFLMILSCLSTCCA